MTDTASQASRTLCLHADDRSADFLYASGGFRVPDPVFWFRHHDRSHLIVPPLELGRARKSTAIDVAHDWMPVRTSLRENGRPDADRLDAVVQILRSEGVRETRVPADFPLATAERMRAAGIAVQAVSGTLFPEREAKSDLELAAIRRVQAANEEALEHALSVLRRARAANGVLRLNGDVLTAERLRAEIAVHLMRNGCLAKNTIVSCGDQCLDAHAIGTGPLLADTSIVIDMFPRDLETGYWADMTRTVVHGKASAELREIYDLVERGQQYAFDRIRAGCETQPIHEGIVQLFEDAGRGLFTDAQGVRQGFIHGTGHGVGLDIHEAPSFGAQPDRLPLHAVVTVEPGLYFRDIGCVRLEDMVLVTEDGCENLTAAPKQLEL